MISITCCYAVVNFETCFKIQGLQVNIAHEIDSMQLLGWVEWMRDERTFLTPKKSAKAASSDACRLCGVNFKISVVDFGDRSKKYISTWKGCSWKNSPSRPFENTSWCTCWTGPTSWKIFLWTLVLNTNPSRQEADRRSKSKHSEILLKSMLFWPEPQSDEWHFLSLELSTLCYALMNSIVPYTNQVLPLLEQLTPLTRDRVKLWQSPHFFRPLVPTLSTLSPLPTGILYSPQFRSHQETNMAARRTQRSTSTISRGNRGLWTVYLKHVSMLSPRGVGGGPRAYMGHLTSIAFPICGNLTENLGPRVGTFAFFARRNGTKSHRPMCSSVCRCWFPFRKRSMPLLTVDVI